MSRLLYASPLVAPGGAPIASSTPELPLAAVPLFKSRHVGVYPGNGEFAQASGRLGVNVARLDNHYWNKKYEGARRLPKS